MPTDDAFDVDTLRIRLRGWKCCQVEAPSHALSLGAVFMIPGYIFVYA